MTDRTVNVTFTEDEARALRDVLRGKSCRTTADCTSAAVKLSDALTASQPEFPEPKHPGAVVMTDRGLRTYVFDPEDGNHWVYSEYDNTLVAEAWDSLVNPRFLTNEERAECNIPTTLPDLDDPTLVERVAKAICRSDGTGGTWEETARAALAVIREATR